jgi:hypothetical protein
MINNAFETVEVTQEHIPLFIDEDHRLNVLSKLSEYVAWKVKQDPVEYHVYEIQMPSFNTDDVPTLRLVTEGDNSKLRDLTQGAIAKVSLAEYKKAS